MSRETIIPILAVLAGVVCAVGLSSGIRNSQTADDQEAREKFSALDPSEQRQLLQKAASFEEALNQKDREHLQEMHAAVQQDPKLATKLKNFREWYQSLSDSQRRQLRETGEKEWVARIGDLYLETQAESHLIHVSQGSFGGRSEHTEQTFSEQEFIEFLDSVLEENEVELTENLKGFDENQVCEVSLVKIFAFFELVHSKGRNEEFRNKVNALYGERLLESGKSPRSFEVFNAVHLAMQHFAIHFRRKYRDGDIVATFESQERDQQIQMLQMDSRDAEHALRLQLIINQFSEDSTEYRLVKRLSEVLRFRSSGFGSRRRGPGNGGRGGFGGGSGQGGQRRGGPGGQQGGGPGNGRPGFGDPGNQKDGPKIRGGEGATSRGGPGGGGQRDHGLPGSGGRLQGLGNEILDR
ncbi:MAG TPA: hypothetical protein DCG12_16510 [Planctomycetaceae bacterium]|nr:hypothetical protein [Planctomycetaceae bacterium]